MSIFCDLCCDELTNILSFLPLQDLIKSELISKQWRERILNSPLLWNNLLDAYFGWEKFMEQQNIDFEQTLYLEALDRLKFLFSMIPKFLTFEEQNERVDRDGYDLQQIFTFSNPIQDNVFMDEEQKVENLEKLVVILSSMTSNEYTPNPITNQVVLFKSFWDKRNITIHQKRILIPLSLFCLIILISEGDEWFFRLDSLFVGKDFPFYGKYDRIVYGVSPFIENVLEDSEESNDQVLQQIEPFCYFSEMDDNEENGSWVDYNDTSTLFPVFFNAGSPYNLYRMEVRFKEQSGEIVVEKSHQSGYY